MLLLKSLILLVQLSGQLLVVSTVEKAPLQENVFRKIKSHSPVPLPTTTTTPKLYFCWALSELSHFKGLEHDTSPLWASVSSCTKKKIQEKLEVSEILNFSWGICQPL